MRKYLFRLLGFSLLLGTLPTLLIGTFAYFSSTRDIEDKVKEGNMQLLQQMELRVEQTLKSAEMSAMQFVHSSMVKSAMEEDLTGEDFILIRNLMNNLFNLQTKSIVSQAYLINFKYDWSVNMDSFLKLEDLPNREQFEEYASVPEGIFWSTGLKAVTRSGLYITEPIAATPATVAEPVWSGPTDTVSLIHKIPLFPNRSESKGLLVLQLNGDDIRSALTPDNRLGSHYVLDRTGHAFLSSKEEQSAYAGINSKVQSFIRQGELTGFFNTRVDHKKVGVAYRSTGPNGWSYISVVSIDTITKETKKIAILTAAVCISILLLVLVLAYIGSKRMYSPIRSLVELTMKVVTDTGQTSGGDTSTNGEVPSERKDELEFIRDRFHLLADSRNRLDQQIQGQVGHLREFFVLKLFTGQMTDGDYFGERTRLYGFPDQWSRLAVLALQIDNLQETRFQEEDRELLLFAINNMVSELLRERAHFTPILLNHSQVTLYASESEEISSCKQELYQLAELVKNKVEQYLGLQVSIGISRPFERLGETVLAYGESLAALKSRMSLGPDIIVFYDDTEGGSDSDTAVYSHLSPIQDQVVLALRELQVDQAVELLRHYMDSMLGKEGFRHERHLLLLQVVSKVLLLVQEQGISIRKVLEGDGAVERLMQLQTREEIIVWFRKRLFAPVVSLLADKAETQYVNIAHRLVQLIHEQYDQEISLESCAAAMNFHPVYLSRVFKKEIGIPFSDYLSDYRMSKSKELLETTQMKISEIGEKIQYKNISAFIRTFRKTYGMTPGQYRETQGTTDRNV